LDEVELIMDLEKSLGIYIPDDDIETKIFKEGNTIQHLVDYVKSRV
jgi:acyl carrier protein